MYDPDQVDLPERPPDSGMGVDEVDATQAQSPEQWQEDTKDLLDRREGRKKRDRDQTGNMRLQRWRWKQLVSVNDSPLTNVNVGSSQQKSCVAPCLKIILDV